MATQPTRRRAGLSLAGVGKPGRADDGGAPDPAEAGGRASAAYAGPMRFTGADAAASSEPPTPREFTAVVDALLAAGQSHSDVLIREVGRPTRLAPHGIALAASLESDDEAELATGRLVVLHDPAGQPAWDGTFRIACYARAPLDAEMSSDPLMPTVTWSWLEDALTERGAEVANLAGTVTTTSSARFGTIADEAATSEVELRCSWSPLWDPEDPADVRAHLDALCDLLAMMAGQPPSSGIVSLSSRVR